MRRGLIYGIVLWAALTLAFKLIVDGDIVRLSGSSLRIILPLIGAGLSLIVGLGLRIAYPPYDATRTGISMAVPGMILGCATLLAFGHFVARPSMEHGIVYAIFLLWTYGLILTAVALFCDEGAR